MWYYKLNMKNIHIENSYKIWRPRRMRLKIKAESFQRYQNVYADRVLNRTYCSMYLEWFLHSIGYWLTLPFIKNSKFKYINERCKHVDLEEYIKS